MDKTQILTWYFISAALCNTCFTLVLRAMQDAHKWRTAGTWFIRIYVTMFLLSVICITLYMLWG